MLRVVLAMAWFLLWEDSVVSDVFGFEFVRGM